MTVEALLKTAYYTPGLNGGWGLPLLFEGEPGVGKSQRIAGAAHACGLDSRTIIASIREPSDFGGLPIPHVEDGRTVVEYAPPRWAMDLATLGRGVVFVDEITTCPPAVQAALLRMVLERSLGDFTLPKGTRFVAACNPAASAAGGWDLAPPLANRFGHLPWESPDVGSWTRWLISGESPERVLHPADEEARVEAAWPRAYANAKGVVTGFLKSRPELLFRMPDRNDPAVGKAWPSPRTWDMSVRALAGGDIHRLGDVDRDLLVGAFVGQGAALELITYREKADLPDPEDVLNGKVAFKHDKRLDRSAAVLSACAARLAAVPHENPAKGDKELLDKWGQKLWGILLDQIVGKVDDLAIPVAEVLLVPSRKNALSDTKAKDKVVGKLFPVVRATGM